MESFGLALTGGGVKGAFQAGALRYFEQHRLFPHITAISGVSIGAVNAVLFALREYRRAFNLWNGADMRALLTPNTGFSIEVIDGRPFGVLKAERVKDVLRKLPLYELHKSTLRIYIAYDVKGSERSGVLCLNDMPRTEDMLEALAAAAAVPFAYPAAKLGEAMRPEAEKPKTADPAAAKEGQSAPAEQPEEAADPALPAEAEAPAEQPKKPVDPALQMEGIIVPEAVLPPEVLNAPAPKQRDTRPAPMAPVPENPLVSLFAVGCKRFMVVTMDQDFTLDRRAFPGCTCQLIQPGEWMIKAELGAPNAPMAGRNQGSAQTANYNQSQVMRLMNDGYNCAHRALTTKQYSAL